MSSFPRSVSPIRSRRRGYCRLLTATLLVSACLFGGRSVTAQDKCSNLATLRLPDVRIVEAAVVEPGEQGNESGEAPHCRVEGVIGREIRFELLLPETWNGRFALGGGGGFVGSLQNAARWSVHFGYATVGTDTGHEGPGTDASWALNQPERQINFGHLAVHRTAETAKAIVRAHYGSDIDYSYFLGCSRGGGQALMEAQRYPEDFDGISSGAPAFDWTGIMAEGLQNMQKLYPDPSRTGTTALIAGTPPLSGKGGSGRMRCARRRARRRHGRSPNVPVRSCLLADVYRQCGRRCGPLLYRGATGSNPDRVCAARQRGGAVVRWPALWRGRNARGLDKLDHRESLKIFTGIRGKQRRACTGHSG